MASKALKHDDEWGEPQRDKRGRFKRGASGNPHGRPRKEAEPPWSFERSLMRELAECVPVSSSNGTSQELMIVDYIIKSIVRGTAKAKVPEQMKVVEWLAKLNIPALLEEKLNPQEELYTDEDRRMIDELSRSVFRYCCRCDKPVTESSTGEAARDEFRFE